MHELPHHDPLVAPRDPAECDPVTPQLWAAIAAAPNGARIGFVLEAMRCTSPDHYAPQLWRALADLVSSWEPTSTPTGLDARLTAACAELPQNIVRGLGARLIDMDDHPLMVALGKEIEIARMRLLDLDAQLWHAMRVEWPENDNA